MGTAKEQVRAVAPFTNEAGGVVSVKDPGVEMFPKVSTVNLADQLVTVERVPYNV